MDGFSVNGFGLNLYMRGREESFFPSSLAADLSVVGVTEADVMGMIFFCILGESPQSDEADEEAEESMLLGEGGCDKLLVRWYGWCGTVKWCGE